MLNSLFMGPSLSGMRFAKDRYGTTVIGPYYSKGGMRRVAFGVGLRGTTCQPNEVAAMEWIYKLAT